MAQWRNRGKCYGKMETPVRLHHQAGAAGGNRARLPIHATEAHMILRFLAIIVTGLANAGVTFLA